MKVVSLSALRNGRLYPPGNIPGTHCVRSCVDRKKGKEECRNTEKEKGKQKLKLSGEDSKEERGKEDK